MGTRLYPRTENPAVLEKLACVPTGTMRRLRSAKAQLITTRKGVRYYLVAGKSQLVAVRNHSDMEEVWDADFQAVYADDHLSALDHFLSYGWGKFSPSASDFLLSIGQKDEGGNWLIYGNLDNPEHIETLLSLTRIRKGHTNLRNDAIVMQPSTNIFAAPTIVPITELQGSALCFGTIFYLKLNPTSAC
jgi:hypothetical protein